MDIMIRAKFYFKRLMLTLIFCVWASEPPPRAWRATEKAGPDRVKFLNIFFSVTVSCSKMVFTAPAFLVS